MWLLVFFLTPIIEMYILIEVGGYIGAVPTIGLVMITAVVGVALLRVQGLATLARGMSAYESRRDAGTGNGGRASARRWQAPCC